MRHYGTNLSFGYILPFRKGLKTWEKKELTSEAQKRLKWMDYIDSGKTVAECSRHFDYPYSTVKYWRDRYSPKNLSTLENRSCRPKRVRKSKLTRQDEQLIHDARKYELPGAGKVTLQAYIENEYGVKYGQQQIQRVISKFNLKRIQQTRKTSQTRQNRKHMYSVPEKVKKKPGGLVYLDVKHLRFGRYKWYQFTALDHATRMLKVRLYRRITAESTRTFFEYLTKEYPFKDIQYVGTDNGSEFLGVFDQDLEKRGIQHVFSSPASPKQNPFVERVIRTIIDQQYSIYGLEDTPELQQEALTDYCYKYNHKRPHHSLNLLTPFQMYAKLKASNSHH